jgi:hypothetical protein
MHVQNKRGLMTLFFAVLALLTAVTPMVVMSQDAPPAPPVDPNVPTAAPSCGEGVIYTTQSGDSLYAIARRLGSTFEVILAANPSITDPNVIRQGIELLIPCAPTPTPVLPTPTAEPGLVTLYPSEQAITRARRRGQPRPQPITVDCRPFHAIAPLDGWGREDMNFYWEPAPGAQSYRFTFYNVDWFPGREVAVESAPGSTNTTVIDTSGANLGGGFVFEFMIEAIANGQVACTTPLYQVLRVPRNTPAPRN